MQMEKDIRHMTDETLYPVTLWCDNSAAGKNTQREGCHKLCNFDEPVEMVIAN